MEQKPNDTRFQDAGGQQTGEDKNRKSPSPNDLDSKKRNPDNEPQAIDDREDDIEDVEAIEEIDTNENSIDETGSPMGNTSSYGQYDRGNDDGELGENTSNDHLR